GHDHRGTRPSSRSTSATSGNGNDLSAPIEGPGLRIARGDSDLGEDARGGCRIGRQRDGHLARRYVRDAREPQAGARVEARRRVGRDADPPAAGDGLELALERRLLADNRRLASPPVLAAEPVVAPRTV